MTSFTTTQGRLATAQGGLAPRPWVCAVEPNVPAGTDPADAGAFRVPEHTLVLAVILAGAVIGLAMVWSVRICHACGKSSLFAVLLFLPGLNYLALVHLANPK